MFQEEEDEKNPYDLEHEKHKTKEKEEDVNPLVLHKASHEAVSSEPGHTLAKPSFDAFKLQF